MDMMVVVVVVVVVVAALRGLVFMFILFSAHGTTTKPFVQDEIARSSDSNSRDDFIVVFVV